MYKKTKFGTHFLVQSAKCKTKSELRHPGDRAKNIYTLLFTLLPLLLLSCSNLDRENPAAAIAVQTAANQSSVIATSSVATLSSGVTPNSSSLTPSSSAATINLSSVVASSSAASTTSSSTVLTGTNIVWDFNDCVGHVKSGGYWYSFNDSAETQDGGPGASKSNFPTPSQSTDIVGLWASTKGMDVTFSINPTAYKYPYAGIGFNWKEPRDTSAQKWASICIEYSLTGTVPVYMLMFVDPLMDGNNNRFLQLPAQDAMGTNCYAAKSFAQSAGWGTIMALNETMSNSLGIRFRAQLKTPPATVQTSHLTIRKVTVQ